MEEKSVPYQFFPFNARFVNLWDSSLSIGAEQQDAISLLPSATVDCEHFTLWFEVEWRQFFLNHRLVNKEMKIKQNSDKQSQASPAFRQLSVYRNYPSSPSAILHHLSIISSNRLVTSPAGKIYFISPSLSRNSICDRDKVHSFVSTFHHFNPSWIQETQLSSLCCCQLAGNLQMKILRTWSFCARGRFQQAISRQSHVRENFSLSWFIAATSAMRIRIHSLLYCSTLDDMISGIVFLV